MSPPEESTVVSLDHDDPSYTVDWPAVPPAKQNELDGHETP